VSVAVVDSGINPQQDLYTVMGVNRLVAAAAFNSGYNQSVYDGYGHGNHVAGIVGGNGSRSSGAYIGVAPMVNLINVKVSDDQASTTANVVRGLQWIKDNRGPVQHPGSSTSR
jgi:serine protease AprX